MIDPDVPAVPGRGTPEIGDCESPAEVPVPPKVPVFDLSQEDEDEAGGPPPHPGHLSVIGDKLCRPYPARCIQLEGPFKGPAYVLQLQVLFPTPQERSDSA